MVRASGCCAALLLVLGCQSGEEPARGARRGVEPVQYQPEPNPPREAQTPPRPERRVDVSDLEGEDEEVKKRDLDAELKAAIGIPTDCVRDFTAPRPTKIRVSISATVRPTGMVILPSAYASGISAAARQCIEQRVSTVVLSALDEPISQAVSTVLEINYEPPVIVEAEPGVPEPQLKNVKEPLPKYPMIPLDGKIIDGWPTANWISGGFDGGVPIQKPSSKKVQGPKPRAIDGYEVDQNAQVWSD